MDGKDPRPKKGGKGKVVESLHSERTGVSFGFDGSGAKTALSRRSSLSLDIPPPPINSATAAAAGLFIDSSMMMIPNTQAIISPTTGTFRAHSFIHESSSNRADGNLGMNLSSSSRFNSHINPLSFPSFSGTEDQVAQSSTVEVHNQITAPKHFSVGYEYTTKFSTEASSNSNVCNSAADHVKTHDRMSQHKQKPIHRENNVGINPPMVVGRSLEDGYNWRKYGQKQVKGSEHSRSYYKCTHPDCPMKKKVEQSVDGQITEIIYKGCHNHPKPQPSRRSAAAAMAIESMFSGFPYNAGVEDKSSMWRNLQPECKEDIINSGGGGSNYWRSSTSAVNHQMGIFTSAPGTEHLSSTIPNHDYEDMAATPGSLPFDDDVDDEDSESKKRAVREPRVVVQVESDFDLLDDGYRWRKYGQKVVKGNPNPRSYYKCTSSGCLVRRHVERASNDPKSVITTYEGKHNHEVPAARKSSHGSSNGGGGGQSTVMALQRNANISRPEALLHELGPHFDMKPEFITTDEYIRSPSMRGNFAINHDHMKFGPSSLQFPAMPMQSITNHYAPLGLDSNNFEPYQPGSVAPPLPPMAWPSGLAVPANLGTPGFDFNLIGQFEPYFMGQQFQENDIRFLHPKEELKDDIGDANVSSSSSKIYHHRTMGNFQP